MSREKNYKEAGYRQGFADGRITGGKITRKYVDYLLETETRNLSVKDSKQYKDGWQDGFIDAVRGSIKDLIHEDGYVVKHLDKIYGIGGPGVSFKRNSRWSNSDG
ncbi:MAG: hypothetical protein JRF02_01595 [Deltaproteobacteria bacterium]|jgi:hypothetical protein|nr:hypothetical protein [Deltaproteobacteria bacterium]